MCRQTMHGNKIVLTVLWRGSIREGEGSVSLSLASPVGRRGTVPWVVRDSVGTCSSSSASELKWSKLYWYFLPPELQVKLTFSTCGRHLVSKCKEVSEGRTQPSLSCSRGWPCKSSLSKEGHYMEPWMWRQVSLRALKLEVLLLASMLEDPFPILEVPGLNTGKDEVTEVTSLPDQFLVWC